MNVSLWSKADGGCVALSTAPSATFGSRGCRVQAKAVIGTPKNPTPLPFLPFFLIYTYTLSDHTSICIFTKEFIDNGEDAEEERQKKPLKVPRQKRKKQVGTAEARVCLLGCRLRAHRIQRGRTASRGYQHLGFSGGDRDAGGWSRRRASWMTLTMKPWAAFGASFP